MYTNGISPAGNTYESTAAAYQPKTSQAASAEQKATEQNTAATQTSAEGVIYEPDTSTAEKSSTARTKAQNAAIVSQMKADLARRKQQLEDMVTKMLGKQANTWKTGTQSTAGIDIYAVLRSGNFEADADTIAQAKADVADDGYWGVEQTSERMLSFAKALTGGDSTKADAMLEAFKKGFEQATGAWGDKLPDLCQRTYEATLKKFEAWKNGTEATGTTGAGA